MQSLNYYVQAESPSGKPELISISFSCTFASQVILRVAMLSLLCSQNLFSASSPPILENKQSELEVCSRKGKVQQFSRHSIH